MAEDRVLSYGGALPATWLAALQEFVGTMAGNFTLSLSTHNTVSVVAGPLSAQVAVGIDGLFRYISSTLNLAVSGAAGSYDVFVTTGPNSFTAGAPGSGETDNTNYAFALNLQVTGNSPTANSTVTNFRKVGSLDWDGTNITHLRQFYGMGDTTQPLMPTADQASEIPLRAVGTGAQTAALQTWETATGAVLAKIAPGALALGDSSNSLVTSLFLQSSLAAVTGGTNVNAVCIARAYRNAGLSVAAAAVTQIVVDTKSFDPGNNISTANGSYTCPYAGYYRVSGEVDVIATASGQVAQALIYQNGGLASTGSQAIAVTAAQALEANVTDVVLCGVGDVLDLRVYVSTALSLQTGADYINYLDVSFEAPSILASTTPNTGARAYFGGSQTIPAGVWTKIQLNTVSFDPGAHFDVATNHRYNVPATGMYQFNGNAIVGELAAGERVLVGVYKNGVAYAQAEVESAAAGGEYPTPNVSDLVQCAAGDYLELWVLIQNGGATTSATLSVFKADQQSIGSTGPPIGAVMPYSGASDPLPGQWVIADGRLIDLTIYASFFGVTGHSYNGGVAPGSNKVKIPDKRGKSSIGAINMGTGAGANDNSHVQLVRGASYGEVNDTLSQLTLPTHGHVAADQGHSHPIADVLHGHGIYATTVNNPAGGPGSGGAEWSFGAANYYNPVYTSLYMGNTNNVYTGITGTEGGQADIIVSMAGSNAPHNTVHPVEADSYIVRIS
jgi:microcystin-dependent protein